MTISHLDTEKCNNKTKNIDRLDTFDIVSLINSEDRKVADSVGAALPAISQAIDAIYEKMRRGGRLVYMGAGTSGRLGVLDAVECPPTFGIDYDTVVALMAGGESAFLKAKEGAEDCPALGKADLDSIGFSNADVLVGIAASGRTPYVIGGLEHAAGLGAFTVSLSCTQNAEIDKFADVNIAINTGAEVVTGSTRMKGGTAQKMVLNMISTALMIKLGKTYGNLMVDVRASNEKLAQRVRHIVCTATGVSEAAADEVLQECGYSAKAAILMIMADIDQGAARRALKQFDGHIYPALNHFRAAEGVV